MARFAVVLMAVLALALPAAAQSRLPAQGFADLAERLTPAVVNIATSQRVQGVDQLTQFPPGSPMARLNQSMDQAAQVTSLGSGFVISADGVVVTNNHVIEEADSIDVITQDGTQLRATVVGRDPATDIAVLRVHPRAPMAFVGFGDSDRARVGDLVLAIGNPFGLGGSLSVGVVSARNRNIDAGRYDDFIQTDAAINRGNSGGPLFDLNGDVIGVNTAIVSPTGASVGVGFATPSAIVKPVVDQILRYGETRRGWLGVRLSNVGQDLADRLNMAHPVGAVVTRVTPDGPADRAGLQPGDIVLRFAGRDVADSRALTRFVGEADIGARVALDVLRGGRRMSLGVVIARLQEQQASASQGGEAGEGGYGMRRDGGPRSFRLAGVGLSELDASLREEFQIEPQVRGLVVLTVDPSSDSRLRPGDVIEQIAFHDVDSVATARAIATRAAHERALVVRINRDGAVSYRRLDGAAAP